MVDMVEEGANLTLHEQYIYIYISQCSHSKQDLSLPATDTNSDIAIAGNPSGNLLKVTFLRLISFN